jgi:predicted Zn-dependent peptidase
MKQARRWISRLVLVSFLLAGPSTALEDPAARTRVTKLENGLVVLTLEDSTTPVVSFQMWVGVGSRDEARYTGLAHLFEHMMFQGSKNLAREEHSRLINARGGSLNAWTSKDFTVYHEDVTSESLPLVIDLEYERLAHLDISQQTLESERQVVVEERRLRVENVPRGRMSEALFATAWKAHPYRRPVVGWRSDIESTTVEACRDFFDTYYSPNNIVIAIVGDFETDATLARIRRSFGRLEPAESIPRNPTVEPEQKGERRTVVRFDISSPMIAMAWHAPPSGSEDGIALDALGQVLSGGRSSRLYRRLVNDNPLALSAHGGYWELRDAGMFQASATARHDADVEEVEAALLDELERLRREPPSEAEVEKARRQLEVWLVNGLVTNHALADRIARDYATFGRIRPLEERLEVIRSVTPADVQRVAEKYLMPEGRTVVTVLPPVVTDMEEPS